MSESEGEEEEAAQQAHPLPPPGQAGSLDVDGATIVQARDAEAGDTRRQREQAGECWQLAAL